MNSDVGTATAESRADSAEPAVLYDQWGSPYSAPGPKPGDGERPR
ncbi:MAG: hypothetical protein OXI97_08725 [Acidimicrobiaceae bacterium]|nr:hypothetical protein [Acidimicrobiaceae bacterium]